jgi:hypothetical protein
MQRLLPDGGAGVGENGGEARGLLVARQGRIAGPLLLAPVPEKPPAPHRPGQASTLTPALSQRESEEATPPALCRWMDDWELPGEYANAALHRARPGGSNDLPPGRAAQASSRRLTGTGPVEAGISLVLTVALSQVSTGTSPVVDGVRLGRSRIAGASGPA